MKYSLILSIAILTGVVTASAMEPEVTNLNPRRSGQPLTKQQMQESQLKKVTSHSKAKAEAKATDKDLANFQEEQQNLMYQQESSEESASQQRPRPKKWYKFW